MTSAPGSRRASLSGESNEEIAAVLGRDPSRVWREIGRGGGRDLYRVPAAQKAATKAGRRPKTPVLAADPVLALLVLARLKDRWSPHAIAAWLRARGDLRCCGETIYAAAYANDARSGLPAGTWKLLPATRRRRRARGRGEECKRGNVLGAIVPVAERPAEAADRRQAHLAGGTATRGPAGAPLPMYQVHQRAGQVEVRRRPGVRSQPPQEVSEHEG